jgi:murein DD-endopeptidase MepM/ murein hydrolase activator NlpD
MQCIRLSIVSSFSFLLAGLLLPRSSAETGRLTFWPPDPRQGQTLFFRCQPGVTRVPSDPNAGVSNARATWDGTAIPLVMRDGTLLGVVGLRITERVGRHLLRVQYQDADGRLERLEVPVAIGVTRFPVRRLKMKRSTERLYTFPGAKREDALVSRAVRTRSAAWLWRGAFRMPATGRQSTPFGVKRIRNERSVYYHRGLDIAAPVGRPITAPNAGRVVLSRRFRKYGNTVVLDHGGGVTSLYLHMSARHVAEGDRVAAGQRIGDVGMTGVATGPHLHWGLYVHGVAVNPLPWTRLPSQVALTSPPSPTLRAGDGGEVNQPLPAPPTPLLLGSRRRGGYGAASR